MQSEEEVFNLSQAIEELHVAHVIANIIQLQHIERLNAVDYGGEILRAHVSKVKVPVLLARCVFALQVFAELCSSVITHVDCITVIYEHERQRVAHEVACQPSLGILSLAMHHKYAPTIINDRPFNVRVCNSSVGGW